MRKTTRFVLFLVLALAALAWAGLSGCDYYLTRPEESGDASASTIGDAEADRASVDAPPWFTVGGKVAGLGAEGLVLQNNGEDNVTPNGNGGFTFAKPLPMGASYAVTVLTQPTSPSQTCVVSKGSGTVGTETVLDVGVTCTTNTYAVGGTVTGLAGAGLVLQNNGADRLSIGQNGAFTFPTALASGSAFNVSVLTQPSSPTQTCTVSGNTGTLGTGAITSVVVNCATETLTVGGTISGLAGSVVLQNNAGNDLTLNADGSFAFSAPLTSGAAYAVTVKTQPASPSQTCTVTSGTGTVVNANITSVRVACVTNAFTVGGTVTGLAGSGLVLQNNAGENLSLAGNGPFAFATSATSGTAYSVTVLAQPSSPTQQCTIVGGTGTVGGTNVTSVAVTCTTRAFTIGGNVTGLLGSGLVLQNNGGDDLGISADGSFVFATPVASSGAWAVTVRTQPNAPTQNCSVSGGAGTTGSGNVTGVVVNCATNTFIVGGTVTGLLGTVVLQNNGGGDLTLNANGTFAFANPVASGSAYVVTVLTQPSTPSQTCVLTNATGTVGSANITSVALTCTLRSFTVGGTVSGLSGTGLVLRNNGVDALSVTANGTFTFATSVASGAPYSVTASVQPTGPSQDCVVTSGTGLIAGANVTSVNVTCTTRTFAVGGTVTGLLGSGLVLQDNGADNLTVGANGTFTFPQRVASGASYAVTVLSQPSGPSQNCVVTNGTGGITTANVTTVTVTCTTRSFTIGGTVTGLVGTGLVLQDNNGDNLSVGAGGPFTFATSIDSGSAFNVTILSQPSSPAQTCSVAGGSGTVGGSNVASVTVNCATNAYSVGGTVSGLAGTLVLQKNAGDDLTLSTNGTFAFTTPISAGAAYNVTVLTQPGTPSQTCTIASGSGTVASAAVTSVVVTCATNRFTISGTLSGLAAGVSVVLRDNGADDLTVSANGAFAFATTVASGAPFAVTVLTNPDLPIAQTCLVTSGGGGIVAGANVSSVTVNCTTNSYTISGTVSGLGGAGLVLQNSGADDLALSANGGFTFTTSVASGAAYAVSVLTPPSGPSQNCSVATGSGTVTNGNITNVAITCATNAYSVGGTVGGLAGSGLVLQNSGGGNLPIATNGSFTFTAGVVSGNPYAVTVASQPTGPSQTCVVTAGNGTVTNANVTSVVVTCMTNTYTVGVSVSGLAGSGLVVRNNGGDNLAISNNGSFTFATPVASGGSYAVTVATQPSGLSQTCAVTGGTGPITSANVAGIAITCTTNSYAVGVSVSGLAGAGLVLRNNGGNDLAISADGSFGFSTLIASGGSYAVTVATQPSAPSQTCSVTGNSGIVTNANIASVVVTCSTNAYTLGGSVSGLIGGGLVLENNGGDGLAISAAGVFTFSTSVVSGGSYAVTVATQPSLPSQTCVVTSDTGAVTNANIASVLVTCTTNTYTVGGTLSGVVGTGLVLRNNAGDDLTLSADGGFTFATSLTSGSPYAVTVATQPSGASCVVSNGSGTVTNNNVTSVVVSCTNTSGSNTVCDAQNEGGTVNLICPAGQLITSIDFASYGTPNGTCGGYSIGGCHNGNSTPIVTAACLGQASCSVAAVNGVFGDPCGFVPKRLYVQVTCSFPAPSFLWLDANDPSTFTLGGGNTVTQWRDKSGLGRSANANPAAPVWTAGITPNGRPAVRFNPTNQRLVTANVTSVSEMTIFVVFNMINPQTWATLFEQAHDTYFGIRKSDCCGGNGNLNFHIQNNNGAPLIPITTNTWRVLTALRQGTTSTISYRGGASASFTGDALIAGGSAPLYVGSSASNESSGAYIAEIRAYASALTAAERSGIEGVLAAKYGLP